MFTGAKFTGSLGGGPGGVNTTTTEEEESEAGGFGAAAGKIAGPLIGAAIAYEVGTYLAKKLGDPGWLKALQHLSGDIFSPKWLTRRPLSNPAGFAISAQV